MNGGIEMGKILVIGAGEYMSLRSERMLAMLTATFPDMEVERLDINSPDMNGKETMSTFMDEFSPWLNDSYKTSHWVYPEYPVKRKPKPYYRQGSRW